MAAKRKRKRKLLKVGQPVSPTDNLSGDPPGSDTESTLCNDTCPPEGDEFDWDQIYLPEGDRLYPEEWHNLSLSMIALVIVAICEFIGIVGMATVMSTSQVNCITVKRPALAPPMHSIYYRLKGTYESQFPLLVDLYLSGLLMVNLK